MCRKASGACTAPVGDEGRGRTSPWRRRVLSCLASAVGPTIPPPAFSASVQGLSDAGTRRPDKRQNASLSAQGRTCVRRAEPRARRESSRALLRAESWATSSDLLTTSFCTRARLVSSCLIDSFCASHSCVTAQERLKRVSHHDSEEERQNGRGGRGRKG